MTARPPWHEDDELWETLGPITMFDARAPARAAVDVAAIEPLLTPGARVLDLCCGPGRHCLELARRGFRVTGVDRTASFLTEGRRHADAEGLAVEYVRDDMRRFVRPAAFDAVLNLSTSFGFFEDPEDDRQVLLNVHESLRSGGVLVMDMVGKELLRKRPAGRTWSERGDTLVLLERMILPDFSWVTDRWILLADGERREMTMSHRPYSAAELAALLESSGFAAVEIWGDLSAAPYDAAAERLVAVARG